ncbi:MAG: hypothetical protein JWO60_786 [Frankiales bacterium]|nr:hypothetical protein [Frankiales bacterium]
MSLHLDGLLPKSDHPHRSFRLTRPAPRAAAPLALAEQVRPALVLQEHQGRALLQAAAREDVGRGGCFSAGPAGIQLWSGPFDGLGGTHGSASHLGSVDWSYDTPVRHYVTVYRVLVTAAGVGAGLSTAEVLRRVLDLAGIDATGDTAPLPVPPPRDPFRSDLMRRRTS